MTDTDKNGSKKPQIPSLIPISRAGVLDNLTGSWRYLRPRYEEKLAPCIAACPAGERIEAWIGLLSEKKYAEALQLIKTVNPFPRVCGRVCFHPCESECNRGAFDRDIAIHALERFVSDNAGPIDKSLRQETKPTGRSVGIIGSGPAGLTCAYHLALRGHSATVYEAETELGGLLRYGIPAYRLPRDVLDAEVNDILELGVDVRAGTRIDDLEKVRANHDSLFVATGFGLSRKLGISGEEGDGVIAAVEFLKLANGGAVPSVGGKVLVVGGGNAAIDAARVALRLGAASTVMYRRSRTEMPAWAPEVEEAEREGVTIQFLAQPVEIIRENGRMIMIECVRNRLGEPDESGRREPLPIEGSNFPVEADTIIVAVGERPDDVLGDPGSSPEGVFAGGDLTSPQRTVAHAIGSGRRAAISIDKSLGGEGKDPADYLGREVVTYEGLNPEYFVPKTRMRIPKLPLHERMRNFEEVFRDIGADAAIEEADRCFHCGACVACDNCFIFCPDIAVKKDKGGIYSIDYDYCKGCGICVHECPHDAMSIDEEVRE
jgi:2-oxoacid:acceptor oxidoreductase delta subunit (pyruvate/2-ketoisovalerate family)